MLSQGFFHTSSLPAQRDIARDGDGTFPLLRQGRRCHVGKKGGCTIGSAINLRQGACLPHWTREGATYAVTFRLADSLLTTILKSWEFEREDIVKTARQMNRELTPPEGVRLDKLYSDKVEEYLDAGAGECWMRRDDVAGVVAAALQHFDGSRYDLGAWCVMPNHVHCVVRSFAGYELAAIVHSWKSFAASPLGDPPALPGRQ